MSNESLRRDLLIKQGHSHVKLLLYGVICITKRQRVSNCLSFILSSPGNLSVSDCSPIKEKPAIRFQ